MIAINNKKGLERNVWIGILIAAIVIIVVVAVVVLLLPGKEEVEICNNNGVCDSDAGETIDNCPNDCFEVAPGEEPGEEPGVGDEEYSVVDGNLPPEVEDIEDEEFGLRFD